MTLKKANHIRVIFGLICVLLQDFIFPNGVAYPIGGQASSVEYILLEIHYDNPDLTSG